MRWTVITGSSLERVPWRNGHGTTRNIVTRLGRDGALQWQAGVADLTGDAPFSVFPHCDRIFTPVAGNPPVALSFDDGPFEPCPLLVPKRFSGERPCRCQVAARGQAFNAVADRRHYRTEVTVLRLQAADRVAAPDAPDVVVYCVSGELTAATGERVMPGDSLLGPGPGQPAIAAADGVAIVVAVRPV